MSDLEAALARFRADLQSREAAAVRRMVADYHAVQQALAARIDSIIAEIALAQSEGRPLGTSWLFQRDRLAALERQVITELEGVTGKTYAQLVAEQGHVAAQAASDSIDLMTAALGQPPAGIRVTFAQLNPRAIEQMVGALQEGSPVKALFDGLPQEAAARIRSSLIRGVALGKNPKTIARAISDDLGHNLTRALTISRTETLRAYRNASLEVYRANSNVVKGWIWISAADERTCPSCFALHGTFHTLDESMGSHANCRCSESPSTRSFAELGMRNVADSRPTIVTGVEKFKGLSDAQQRKILTPAAYRAYKDGAVSLADFVKATESPVWGTTRSANSLSGILGPKAAAKYYAPAAPTPMPSRGQRRQSA